VAAVIKEQQATINRTANKAGLSKLKIGVYHGDTKPKYLFPYSEC
jgi:ATP-dependent helicase YprA (DUF1998 family)